VNRTILTTGRQVETPAQNEPKPWFASLAIWGGLLSLAGSLLALLKVQIDPALLEDIRQWVLALAAVIGAGMSLWGRLRATRPIRTPLASASPGARRVLLMLLSLSAACALGGCQVLGAPAGPYVAADRATFDAVAPEYSAYLSNDPALTPDERARAETARSKPGGCAWSRRKPPP
jgi:hypothetical protein